MSPFHNPGPSARDNALSEVFFMATAVQASVRSSGAQVRSGQHLSDLHECLREADDAIFKAQHALGELLSSATSDRSRLIQTVGDARGAIRLAGRLPGLPPSAAIAINQALSLVGQDTSKPPESSVETAWTLGQACAVLEG